MTDVTTGAMQQIGIPTGPYAAGQRGVAGLVLLYAEEYSKLPGAWTLSKPRTVLGRDDTADLCLPIAAVSRTHAEIAWDECRWVVRDLGSRNGTLLDGHPITNAVLERGAELRIGDGVFKFLDHEASEYSAYTIDGNVSGQNRLVERSDLIGGWQMDRIAADLTRVAPTNISVMLLGESGTGKEVAARELHRASGRKGAFHAINCAAIPATLLESELFGYKRGAFSGADRDKPGLIRAADGGTLFLDEIGDMPLDAQAKLLRVLQAKEVLPLGATTPEPVDVRVVCATHRDLGRMQREGRFREDLYARLNEYEVFLPPLHERKEDIHVLARSFLARAGYPSYALSFPFMTGLLQHDFPYNVRELEACIKRSIALSNGPTLGPEVLPEAVKEAMNDYGKSSSSSPPVRPIEMSILSVPSEPELRALLVAHQGNVAAVGRELGKARMQIHRWMKRYG